VRRTLLAMALFGALLLLFLFLRARSENQLQADGTRVLVKSVEEQERAKLESADAALPLSDSAAAAARAMAEGTRASPDAPAGPEPDARIDGLVVLPDGRPAPLARVQYIQWRSDRGPEDQPEDSTMTDEQGLFTLNPAPTGRLRLVAMSDEFASSAANEFELAPGERKRNLRLELREYGRIRALVLDAHDAPRAGIALSCQELATGKAQFGETDAAGRFEFTKAVPGDQLVSFKLPREELEELRTDSPYLGNLFEACGGERGVEVAPGQTVEVVLGGITAGALHLTGHVRCGERLLPRIWIAAESDEIYYREAPRARTNERGEYELWIPGAGAYRFQVLGAGGGLFMQREHALNTEHEQQLDFDLPGASLSGRVVDRAGVPQAGVQVTLSGSAASPVHADDYGVIGPLQSSDAEGHFAFVFLPPDTYELRALPVSKPDAESVFGAARLRGIELAAGATRNDVEIVLTPGCTIRGTVHGAPEGGERLLRVLAYDESGHAVASTRVDPDASFVLRGLSEGSYGLRASGYTYEGAVAAPLRVRAGREEQVELSVGPAAMVTLSAKWPAGVQPLALELVLRDTRGNRVYEANFDPQWPVRLRYGLAAGTYALEFSAAGGWSGTETLIADSGKESSLEVLLRHAK